MLTAHMGSVFSNHTSRVLVSSCRQCSAPYRALCGHVTVCLCLGFHCQLSFQDPLHGHVLTAIACGFSLILISLPAPLPLLLHSCRTEIWLFTPTPTLTCLQWVPFSLGTGMRNLLKRGRVCFKCTCIQMAPSAASKNFGVAVGLGTFKSNKRF